MRTTIPAEESITCDICSIKCDPKTNFKKGTSIECVRSALDMYDQACARADYQLDMCDDCELEFTRMVNAWRDAKRLAV